MLRALDDPAPVLESAAPGYAGELKTEPDAPCGPVGSPQPGCRCDAVQRALPDPEAALDAVRRDDAGTGAGLLSRVSRTWWQAFQQ